MALFSDKKFKCPYCLHEFTREEAKMNRNSRGDEYFMCPNDQLDANGRPLCGKRLPLNFFTSDSSVISIVGGTGAGKTYFVMALKRILDGGVLLNRLGISGTTYYPDRESEDYFEGLLQQIIDGTKLNATQKNAGVERHALCLQVNISGNRIKRTKTIYFSFFDNPGEGFKRDSYILDNMNLHLSDAVIFLISPEQLPNILPKVNGQGLVQNATSLLTVLTNIEGVFNRDRESPQNESRVSGLMNGIKSLIPYRITIPFAFCLSKCDLLSNVFPIIGKNIPRDLYRDDFQTLGIITGSDVHKERIQPIINTNSDSILKILDENDECNIENHLKNYSNYRLFAVQSVEVSNNNNGQEVINLSPKGISFTMYWLLNRLNLV